MKMSPLRTIDIYSSRSADKAVARIKNAWLELGIGCAPIVLFEESFNRKRISPLPLQGFPTSE